MLATLALSGCGEETEGADPLQGLWRSEGYGWIYAVEGDAVRVYEVTSSTCGQVVSGALVATGREATGPARIDLEVPGGFVLGMSVVQGPAGTLHFVPDGLVAGPPAQRIDALPPACEAEAPSDDLTAFDTLDEWLSEHYALFEARDVDWDELVAQQRARLVGQTPEPFFDVVVDLLAPLQDAHVSIVGPTGAFEGRREEAEPVTDQMLAQAQEIISSRYLVSMRETWLDGQIERAWLPGEVAYVAAHGFGPLVDADGRLDYLAGVDALETALDRIFEAPMNGLVLDLRTNGGGSDLYGLAIAARLTREPYLAYTIEARLDPNDRSVFGNDVPVMVLPSDRPGFDGPVAVLIGRDTVSAGETAALALRGRPGITSYGERTQGAFSSVLNHFLPNGWLLGLPNERYVSADEARFDVVGLPPDVPTSVFSAEDIAAERDAALDRALLGFDT